jgi:hypothetical protein
MTKGTRRMTTGTRRMTTGRMTTGAMTVAAMRPAAQALTSPRGSLGGRGDPGEAGAGRP